jgi:GNAT superfamily N-acetyltransferase
MHPKYPDLSTPELARLTEENLYEFLTTLGQADGASLINTRYLTCYSDPSIISPMFNGVVRTDIPPDQAGQAGQAIDEALDYFASRSRPMAFWWVGPSTRPANLGALLVAHGLVEFESNAPSMAVDLHALPSSIAVPQDFAIEIVRDRSGAEAWAETFNAIYGTPQFAGQAWADAITRYGFERAPFSLYLGRWHGKPVATNMLILGAGVASVLGVGTLPEARGQGIGSAITLQPYLDARALGYHTGVLFATELGIPVYERLGFRKVGAISRYLWRAS